MKTERDFIIDNIEEIQYGPTGWSNGRSKSTMRWKNFQFKDYPIEEVDFYALLPKDLVDFYAKVVRRLYTQM